VCYFFFFSSRRRHTRFSRDWSSDVCSSDLSGFYVRPPDCHYAVSAHAEIYKMNARQTGSGQSNVDFFAVWSVQSVHRKYHHDSRSEERRVGKESRCRWSPSDEKKKETL